MTVVTARFAAALLAFSALVSSGAVAQLRYACDMHEGRLTRACCCKHERHAEPRVETIRRQCCSAIPVMGASPATAPPTDSHLAPSAVALPLAFVMPSPPPRPRVMHVRTARGPPSASGPPIYLRHRSILR